VLKAHRWLYHPTLGLRLIQKERGGCTNVAREDGEEVEPSRPRLVPACPKNCTRHVREPLRFPKNTCTNGRGADVGPPLLSDSVSVSASVSVCLSVCLSLSPSQTHSLSDSHTRAPTAGVRKYQRGGGGW